MVAFRGHLVGDDAVWIGVDWFMPFACLKSDGTAYDLTGYTAAALVHGYAGASSSAVTMAATIDGPATLGTGLLTIAGVNSTGMKAGKDVYRVVLTPAGGSASAAHPPIVFYGDIELRTR